MIKKVGGYITTVVAAMVSVYFVSSGDIVLAALAAIFSFSANYYTDFVLVR
jgi:hypothetical protein